MSTDRPADFSAANPSDESSGESSNDNLLPDAILGGNPVPNSEGNDGHSADASGVIDPNPQPARPKSKGSKWTDHDWIWNALTVGFLVLSGSLSASTLQAFSQGSWDMLQTFSTLGQGAGLVFVTGGALTDRGRHMMQKILSSLGIAPRYQAEASCGAAAAILAVTYGINQNLDMLGNYYYEQGEKFYSAGELAKAGDSFNHGLNFSPDDIRINIALGYLQEKSMKYREAQSFYTKGVAFGLPEALAGMGRTTMRQSPTLQSLDEAQLFFQLALSDPSLQDPLRADIFAQLGLLHLMSAKILERQDPLNWKLEVIGLNGVEDPVGWLYQRSEENLQQSIAIMNRLDPNQPGIGMSHCYLAEVMESTDRLEQAKLYWQDCIDRSLPVSFNQIHDILRYGGKDVAAQINTTHIVTRQEL